MKYDMGGAALLQTDVLVARKAKANVVGTLTWENMPDGNVKTPVTSLSQCLDKPSSTQYRC